jgi:flagellar motor switch protein FliG
VKSISKLSTSDAHLGAQKTAIIFLCLGEERGSELMKMLEPHEITQITVSMSNMGEVTSSLVGNVMAEFTEMVGHDSGIYGSISAARSLLSKFLPEERVAKIFEEIDAGDSRDLWQELTTVDHNVLANFLRREHAQTISVILSRLPAGTVAQILPLLGQEKSVAIVERMANMPELSASILVDIEESLRSELLSNQEQNAESEMENHLVSVFNKLEGEEFERIALELENSIPRKLKTIRQKMFVFEDLQKFSPNALALIMRDASREAVPLALRGAKKELREHFLSALPQRSRDMLSEEMKSMGPVKSKAVKSAQSELVDATLTLAKSGQIEIPSDDEEEDMIDQMD